MRREIDRDDLPVTAQTILVMKNCGPKGGPGFPEWGQIPMPRVLLKQGIADMVRISDARMSGTSFGTVVLHAAPESAVGGPLAAVETGDEVELDTEGRRLTLLVPDSVIHERLAKKNGRLPTFGRGYQRLFMEHVLQADEGCDFDFLRNQVVR
jgi:dihydroxy-acid dehydratase